MQPVILLVTDPALLADLDAAAAACATVAHCRSPSHATRVLQRSSGVAVIIELRDAHGRSTAMTIAALRRKFPAVRILGVVRTTVWQEVLEIVPATRAGLDELLIIPASHRDVRGGTLTTAVREALTRAGTRSAEADVRAALSTVVCKEISSAMDFAVRRAREPWDVGTLATTMGIHRSTLVRRLKHAGGIHPSTLLLWARLLLAARLAEDRGQIVQRIATDAGFPSSIAFRKALRRTMGLSPSDLRRTGGLQFAVRRFAACITRPSAGKRRA